MVIKDDSGELGGKIGGYCRQLRGHCRRSSCVFLADLVERRRSYRAGLDPKRYAQPPKPQRHIGGLRPSGWSPRNCARSVPIPADQARGLIFRSLSLMLKDRGMNIRRACS
jgi:hypothetical protein